MKMDHTSVTVNIPVSDLISELEWSIIESPQQSVSAIMSAIEDDPVSARRAGLGETLINIACGLEWSRSTTDIIEDGAIYALSRLRAICRFLTGLDTTGSGYAMR